MSIKSFKQLSGLILAAHQNQPDNFKLADHIIWVKSAKGKAIQLNTSAGFQPLTHQAKQRLGAVL